MRDIGNEDTMHCSTARVVAIVSGTVLVATAGLALVLVGTVTPPSAVTEPESEITEQDIVFGDHTGHVGYTP